MPWVRFEDRFPIHRKVAPLDDATYRLHSEAVFWCARETTDGRIGVGDLASISTRAKPARVAMLVDRGLWHAVGQPPCPNPTCPPPGPDGWVIHDYFEYQPTREKVKADLAAKAERTRKWREGKGGTPRTGDASRDASHREPVTRHVTDTYAARDASPSPPRPAPKGRGGPAALPAPPAADGDGVAAVGGGEDQTQSVAGRCRTCGNGLTSSYHRNTCRGSVDVPARKETA